MDPTSSAQPALYQDQLTGLTTVQGFVSALPGGAFDTAGELLALTILDLDAVNRNFSPDASEILVREVAQRLLEELPADVSLLRGPEAIFIVWLPAANAGDGHHLAQVLQEALYTSPIVVADGGEVYPKIGMVAMRVTPGISAWEALVGMQQALVRTPDVYAQDAGGLSPDLHTLNERLESMHLFGQEHLIEEILSRIHLTTMRPETVIISGQPQAGKTRLLGYIAGMLSGQQTPVVQYACRPADQPVPFSLVTALIHLLLPAFPPAALRRRLQGLCTQYPWLGSLFPVLLPSGPSLPEQQAVMGAGLAALLKALAEMQSMIAVINRLHLADADSLIVLATQQHTGGHGFHLIGGVDADIWRTTEPLQQLLAPPAVHIALPPLSREQLLTYLQEALPDLANGEVVEHLFTQTDGLPLAVETLLRNWVVDGILRRTDGRWHVEMDGAAAGGGYGHTDEERLAVAALMCPARLELLTTLWHTTEPDAEQTVLRGRALGYFRPIDQADPRIVDFSDPDEAATFAARLTEAQRLQAHAEIAHLLQRTAPEQTDQYPGEMVYHLMEAGQQEHAQPYREMLEQSLANWLATIVPTSAMGLGLLPALDLGSAGMPMDLPPEENELPRVIDAILTLRLVGVGYRLYPPNSGIIRQSLQDALQALEALFTTRNSLVVSFDGKTVEFDGMQIDRREVGITVKDYQAWLGDARLQALGFFSGITLDELARFFETLGTFNPQASDDSLQQKLLGLHCEHIRLTPKSRLGQSRGAPAAGNAWPMSAPGMPGMGGFPGLPSTGAQAPFNAASSGTPIMRIPVSPPPASAHAGRQPDSAITRIPSGMPPVFAPSPDHAVDAGETALPDAASPAQLSLPNIQDLTPEEWERLPKLLREATTALRRTMITNLTRWLNEQRRREQVEVPAHVDAVLTSYLECEEDPAALEEVLRAVTEAITPMLQHQQWDRLRAMMLTFSQHTTARSPESEKQRLAKIYDHIVGIPGFREAFEAAMQLPAHEEPLRQVVSLLGVRVWPAAFNMMVVSGSMQVRMRVLHLLREIGPEAQSLILRELREKHPWYVHRNLLSVLVDVGNKDALGTVGVLVRHADHRVRGAALNAVVQIGKEAAAPYLVDGLGDGSADVRARAASLVGLCPSPLILQALLKLLNTSRLAKPEPENVQLAACLALGQFTEPEAREMLLNILQPRLYSMLRRKSDEVRSAAVTALASHLVVPAVAEAVKQAARDRSPLVRQTALRVWQQHAAQEK